MGGKKPQDVVADVFHRGSDIVEQGTFVLDATATVLRQRLKPYLPLPPTPRKIE